VALPATLVVGGDRAGWRLRPGPWEPYTRPDCAMPGMQFHIAPVSTCGGTTPALWTLHPRPFCYLTVVTSCHKVVMGPAFTGGDGEKNCYECCRSRCGACSRQ
jgi:hypothetical protein